MPTLDLLLPTYRWGRYVRGYIGYLASIIEDTSIDVRLHIGDNSCNPEKHEFLRSIASSRIVLHLHPVNVGMHSNATHLFRHSASELVQVLSDDDWIHPSSFAHATFLQSNPDCSACAGFFAVVPPFNNNRLECFNDRFMIANPVDRAIDYVQFVLWETGVNLLALAVYRRSIMATYIEYSEKNPFPFYFRDQGLSQMALLLGPVKGLREGFEFYNLRSPDEMKAHVERQCKAAEDMGLAGWLFHYYDFWLACEYATVWLYRGLPDTSFSYRMEDADRVFVKIFDRFRANYLRDTKTFDDHFRFIGIEDAMHTVLDDPSAITGLRSMVTIFTKINPDSGKRYADFLKKEMVMDVV